MRPNRASVAFLALAAACASGGSPEAEPAAAPPLAQASGTGSREGGGWIFPGEYESHQAMWMLWPTYENKAGFPSTEPMAEMIGAMAGRVAVNLAVQDADDEAGARDLLTGAGVPLDHVHFFHLPHLDIWARDMGPQFTRDRGGRLRVNDWNFNYWGDEEPDSANSLFDEPFDRTVASVLGLPTLDARPGPVTGVRMIHEGGAVTHNGRGTMIAFESVAMQRNLGPGRFCGGQAPVNDFSQPSTYAPNPDWPACRALLEAEYRRMLGARKVIWLPAGVIEDTGTFRGALARHLRVPELDGVAIPHAGVYTMFGVNGHADELVRFVSPDTVVLARETPPRGAPASPAEELVQWLQMQNHERLERVAALLARETTESGEPIRIVRIPAPVPTLDVLGPGDGTYDYYAAYDRWEDGSTLPGAMLGVWASSYVNYVPTNDLVIVSRFWKPGRSAEIRRRDEEARRVLREVFPGRKVVQVYSENLNRGGGGMNCITQQQPASAGFAAACGWARVRVGWRAALFERATGDDAVGPVPRLSGSGGDVYLQRRAARAGRVEVEVHGPTPLDGRVGWVEESAIEAAAERCPGVYALD